MLFAARVPISVGLVQWPSGSVATVVIKRSYDLASRGVATPSRVQEPLGLDRHDASGALLHPSDFAPTKAMCDVAVIGAALFDAAGPVRIVVGEMRRLVDRAAALAPRPGPGPLGDPTEPSLARQWTGAAFDFELFQWAPREQRLPIPTLPLDVVVDVGSHRAAVRIEGPAPTVLLVDETGRTAPRPLVVRLDGIGLDLARQRIDLVWRGLVEVAPASRPLLVVDPSATLHAVPPHEAASWPRAEAVEPSVLRRLLARRPPQDTIPLDVLGADLEATHAGVALDDFGDDADASSGSITSKISVPPPDEALPFVPAGAVASHSSGGAAPSTPPSGPSGGEDERRATVAFEVPPDLAGTSTGSNLPGLPFAPVDVDAPVEDPLVRTVARVASPAVRSVLPFLDAVAPRPPPRALLPLEDHADLDPLVATAAVVPDRRAPLPFLAAQGGAQLEAVRPAFAGAPPATPALASPAPVPPTAASLERAAPRPTVLPESAPPSPPPPARAAPAVSASGITPEQYGAIRAELWTTPDGRRATLRKHGLDEVTWRLAERRFVQSVARARADEARDVVRRLRDEVSRRAARRGA